jgi:hypothetical protein
MQSAFFFFVIDAVDAMPPAIANSALAKIANHLDAI